MVNRTGLERSALPIRDPEILSFIKKIDTNNFFTKSLLDLTITDELLQKKKNGKFEY